MNHDGDQDTGSITSARSSKSRRNKTKTSNPCQRRLPRLDSVGNWGTLEHDDLSDDEPESITGGQTEYIRNAHIVGENMMSLGADLMTRGHALKTVTRRNSLTYENELFPPHVDAWRVGELSGPPVTSSMVVPDVVELNDDCDQSDIESLVDASERYGSVTTDRPRSCANDASFTGDTLMGDLSSAASLASVFSIDGMSITEVDDEMDIALMNKSGEEEAPWTHDVEFKELYDAAFEITDGPMINDHNSWTALELDFTQYRSGE